MLWREDNFVFGQIWKFHFMHNCGLDQSFTISNPTFDEWKSTFGVQSSQKKDHKTGKMRKCPKTANFWACFGVFEQLNLFSLNFAVAVKLVGMLKSRGISWSQAIFVKKCWFFTKSQSVLGGKCARNIKLDMKWIEFALKCCTFTLISLLGRIRSNVQCKIWNCPSH